MRACFLGQNVCALGYGVAMLQSPPLADEAPGEPLPDKHDRTRTRLTQPGADPHPDLAKESVHL